MGLVAKGTSLVIGGLELSAPPLGLRTEEGLGLNRLPVARDFSSSAYSKAARDPEGQVSESSCVERGSCRDSHASRRARKLRALPTPCSVHVCYLSYVLL